MCSDTANCWMRKRRGALTLGSTHSTSLGMHWRVWVMRRECCSLEKCSWYWRARLSGSATKQLMLDGFCHCCFYTFGDSALLLFCSISYFSFWYIFILLSSFWLFIIQENNYSDLLPTCCRATSEASQKIITHNHVIKIIIKHVPVTGCICIEVWFQMVLVEVINWQHD